MKLLIDTNIVLDVLEQREPYYEDSRQVMMLCETGTVEGCVSVLTFANIVYIMRKSLDADKIQQIYEALSGVFTFIDLRAEDMAKASRMKWKDFEDALQAAEIVRIEDRRELCRDCTGDCRQNTKGYYDVVSPTSSGLFHCTMVLCEHERARQEQARLNRLIQSGGIPKAYAGKTLGDYIPSEANRKAVDVAKWLIEYQDKGALFYGATGTGKTLLAAIVAQEKMKRGISVVFASVPDLLMDIRDSFGTGRTAEILRSVQRAPCLVLDDLGADERVGKRTGLCHSQLPLQP